MPLAALAVITSQSPENGSRLCKMIAYVFLLGAVIFAVAIP